MLSPPIRHLGTFTEEERRLFEDTEYYKSFRHSLESELNVTLQDVPWRT